MTEDIIYFPRIKKQPLKIDLAGISYCDGTYRITRANSSIYVFEYIIKGTGTILYNDDKYTASEGDVYIMHKGSRHVYTSDSKDPWTKMWFNIDGDLVDGLVNAYRLTDVVVIKNCRIQNLFNDFISISRSSKDDDEILSLCSLKLHEIIAAIHDNIYNVKNHSNDATVLKEYLDKKVNSTVTLQELSNLIFRSPAQTIRIFKKEYGMTPYAYLLEIKVKTAKLLLINTHMSIKQISYELNFADEHYFSNIFKKATGFSPKQYRNR
jgi:AraC-like DNA-binding protein